MTYLKYSSRDSSFSRAECPFKLYFSASRSIFLDNCLTSYFIFVISTVTLSIYSLSAHYALLLIFYGSISVFSLTLELKLCSFSIFLSYFIIYCCFLICSLIFSKIWPISSLLRVELICLILSDSFSSSSALWLSLQHASRSMTMRKKEFITCLSFSFPARRYSISIFCYYCLDYLL